MTSSARADLLIVGASFAGVACAIEAARAGLRVILIERKADAGEKLHTTGIVVKEAADEIERLGQFPPELILPIRGVRLYGSKLASVALDSPGYFFLATDTPNLMRWLIEQAVNAGVDVRLGTLFTGASREAGGFTAGDIGRVRFIVGADGPTSKVARTFGLGVNREFLFGVEAELTGVAPPGAAAFALLSRPPARARVHRLGLRWRRCHPDRSGRQAATRGRNRRSRRVPEKAHARFRSRIDERRCAACRLDPRRRTGRSDRR